ncbi:MAG: hypothetical protein LUC94_01480 [Clostridiales bacterium]|nr:hypothetical protein [Clostridiales bacterium]
MPIQLIMYSDRMEIINPGGLYGRLTVDQLGQAQPDTRNPVLVTAMETLGKAENRYSGIPTIRYAMKKQSLPEPVFVDCRGDFKVVLYHKPEMIQKKISAPSDESFTSIQDEKACLSFAARREAALRLLNILEFRLVNTHFDVTLIH